MAFREPFASRSGVALPPEHTRAVLSNVDAAFRRGLRPSMSMVVRTGRAGDGGWRMEDGGWRLAAAARGALRRSFGFF
jgi:hypothetical protein